MDDFGDKPDRHTVAIFAMHGLLAGTGIHSLPVLTDTKEVAKKAYEYADAMVAEGEKPRG